MDKLFPSITTMSSSKSKKTDVVESSFSSKENISLPSSLSPSPLGIAESSVVTASSTSSTTTNSAATTKNHNENNNITKKRSIVETGSDNTSITKTHINNNNNSEATKKAKLESTFRYVKVVASKIPVVDEYKNDNNNNNQRTAPIQTYISILESKSYPTQSFSSLSKYYSKPSELQKASFGNAVTKAVHSRDCTKLQSLLQSGLSPNPCNQFGDSILNIICKRGQEDLFQTVINCGTSIHTSDFFGRTPLHFVCWSSAIRFSIVKKILELDVDMLRAIDKVGKTPLDYISADKWDEWNAFLMKYQDYFWPNRDINQKEKEEQNGPNDSTMSLIEQTLSDPENALSIEKATLVSSGKISL